MNDDRDHLLDQLIRLNRLLAHLDADPLYPPDLTERMTVDRLSAAVRTTEDHYSHIVQLLTEQESK